MIQGDTKCQSQRATAHLKCHNILHNIRKDKKKQHFDGGIGSIQMKQHEKENDPKVIHY